MAQDGKTGEGKKEGGMWRIEAQRGSGCMFLSDLTCTQAGAILEGKCVARGADCALKFLFLGCMYRVTRRR